MKMSLASSGSRSRRKDASEPCRIRGCNDYGMVTHEGLLEAASLAGRLEWP
jgi:hypothetical protein